MNKQIDILKGLLGLRKHKKYYEELNHKLLLFESGNGLLIPPDLAAYFKLPGTNELNKDLYQFYTFDQFKSVEKELAHWGGIPDYRNIVNTLHQCENCFVFADYMFHLFSYAIRLYPKVTSLNEIYLICGDKHKIVANSFSEFLSLYFDSSVDLISI